VASQIDRDDSEFLSEHLDVTGVVPGSPGLHKPAVEQNQGRAFTRYVKRYSIAIVGLGKLS
jgi:hypothetical protein